MGGIFIDSNGNINSHGIELALKAYQVPEETWKEYIEKIIVFLGTALRTQRGE